MKWMLIGMTILTTACTTSGAVTDVCAGWEPIRLDGASIDGLTDRDAEAILDHNEFGRALGCW